MQGSPSAARWGLPLAALIVAAVAGVGPAVAAPAVASASVHTAPTSNLCGRMQRVLARAGVSCTHGGDPAPGGIDVHDRARRMRDWARPGTVVATPSAASATAPGAAQAQAVSGGAVPCVTDGTSGDRVQAIYAHAAGAADNYAQFLSSIRGWAADVDRNVALSAAQTGGLLHVRWVTNASCQLDVLDVTLSANALSTSDPSVWAQELQNQGFGRADRKYLMWADADQLCGIATFYQDERADPAQNYNNGAAPTFARVDRGCWGGPPAGLDRSVETHELGHMLGAVLDHAPHHTQSGHCYDGADVMCQQQGSDPPTLGLCPSVQQSLYDCNHDDYFSTSPAAGSYLATNWDAANSSFLNAGPAPATAPVVSAVGPAVAAPGATVTLTVQGTNFHAPALVQLEQAGRSAIQLPAVQVSATQLTGSVTIPLLAGGAWTVRVINGDDAGTATLSNAFTVVGASVPAPPSPPASGSGPAPAPAPAPAKGPVAFDFVAYPGFGGGATVAAGDVVPGRTGAEVVTGAGPGGGPDVQVMAIDPATGRPTTIAGFYAYDPHFTGGVRVAVGEFDGNSADGKEVATAPGPGGGPDVRVWKVAANGAVSLLYSFMAYDPGFRGGVSIAAGDVDPSHPGDEIVTGAGPGGGPHVRVFSGTTGSPGFYAFDPGFGGGVNVAVGRFGAMGSLIVAGAGAGGGPDVETFTVTGGRMGGFFAYDPRFTGGVSVGAGDVDGQSGDEIVTGPGAGGGADVRAYHLDGAPVAAYIAYPVFTGGVQVAAGDTDGDGRAEVITVPWTGGPVVVLGRRL